MSEPEKETSMLYNTLIDLRVAIGVATMTASSGLASFLAILPEELGKLATLIGILLSSVLIYTHIKKTRRDAERHTLEMKLMRKQLADTKDKKE